MRTFVVEQHLGQWMTTAAGRRTSQFLRPPIELGRGHLRLADAVGRAEQLLLQRSQRDMAGITPAIDEYQRDALLRLHRQPLVDEALQHGVLFDQLDHAGTGCNLSSSTSSAGWSSTTS